MTTKLHTCAAEACEKQISRRHWMCIDHWRMVPAALRSGLRAAWNSYSIALKTGQSPGGFIGEVKTAQRQAIAAVREKEIRRALKSQRHGDVLNFE